MSFLRVLAITLSGLLSGSATAQGGYPERPIRMIVPSSPGGGTDLIARMVAERLGASLGQPVVVENKPGASGNIGVQVVTASEPDGYTILLTYGPNITINPSLFSNAGFAAEDLLPVILLAKSPYVVVVNPDIAASTLEELVTVAKAAPAPLSFSSAPVGSADHIAGELFARATGIELLNVPYPGAAAGLVDVMGGRVDMSFVSIPTSLQHIQAGNLRALGITDSDRAELLPGVPTVSETIPDFEVFTWYGVWVPAATPGPVVETLTEALRAIAESEDVAGFLKGAGYTPAVSTGREFAEFSAAEAERYRLLIEQAGLKVEE